MNEESTMGTVLHLVDVFPSGMENVMRDAIFDLSSLSMGRFLPVSSIGKTTTKKDTISISQWPLDRMERWQLPMWKNVMVQFIDAMLLLLEAMCVGIHELLIELFDIVWTDILFFQKMLLQCTGHFVASDAHLGCCIFIRENDDHMLREFSGQSDAQCGWMSLGSMIKSS